MVQTGNYRKITDYQLVPGPVSATSRGTRTAAMTKGLSSDDSSLSRPYPPHDLRSILQGEGQLHPTSPGHSQKRMAEV